MANQKNSKQRSDHVSGYKGVSWDKKANKWCSQIWAKGKCIYLGYFNSPEEAYQAYKNYLEADFPELASKEKLSQSEYKKNWRVNNKDKVSVHNARYREANKERLNANDRQIKWDLRISIINAYGRNCECCGESTPEFLTIDHINGGGNEHRKVIGGGYKFYRWLKDNEFPKENYRLLCYNCNCA